MEDELKQLKTLRRASRLICLSCGTVLLAFGLVWLVVQLLEYLLTPVRPGYRSSNTAFIPILLAYLPVVILGLLVIWAGLRVINSPIWGGILQITLGLVAGWLSYIRFLPPLLGIVTLLLLLLSGCLVLAAAYFKDETARGLYKSVSQILIARFASGSNLTSKKPLPVYFETASQVPTQKAEIDFDFNTAFNQAVELARAGQKFAAYNTFKFLQTYRPDEINLLLWIAFTSPYLAESAQIIDRLTTYYPANEAVKAAETWLNGEKARQTASSATLANGLGLYPSASNWANPVSYPVPFHDYQGVRGFLIGGYYLYKDEQGGKIAKKLAPVSSRMIASVVDIVLLSLLVLIVQVIIVFGYALTNKATIITDLRNYGSSAERGIDLTSGVVMEHGGIVANFSFLFVVMIPLILSMTYHVALVMSRGQTLGHRLLKLKVIRTGGGPVNFGRAFLRALWGQAYSFVVGLIVGFLLAALVRVPQSYFLWISISPSDIYLHPYNSGAFILTVIGTLLALIGALTHLLLRPDRRGMHDWWADTYVIQNSDRNLIHEVPYHPSTIHSSVRNLP